MKQLMIFVAVNILMLSNAFAGNWMISGDIGKALGDADTSELNNQISEQGLNVTATSSNHNRTAWQLLLGYQYTAEWAVEIGYVDLGEVSTKLSGSTTDIDEFLVNVSDIHPLTAYGWQLSTSYRYPIDATATILLRAGILDWKSNYKLETTGASHTVSGNGSSGIIGAGIEKEIGQNKKLNFTFSWYDIDGESISILGVGLTYTMK